MIILLGNAKSGKTTFSHIFADIADVDAVNKIKNTSSTSTVSIESVIEAYVEKHARCTFPGFAAKDLVYIISDRTKFITSTICAEFGLSQADIQERKILDLPLRQKYIYSFAYPMKLLLSLILDIDPLIVLGESSDKYGKRERLNLRPDMEKLAGIFRKVADNFWAVLLSSDIERSGNYQEAIITDMRFLIELQWLKPLIEGVASSSTVHFVHIRRGTAEPEYQIGEIVTIIKNITATYDDAIKLHVVMNNYSLYDFAYKANVVIKEAVGVKKSQSSRQPLQSTLQPQPLQSTRQPLQPLQSTQPTQYYGNSYYVNHVNHDDS